MKPRSAPPQRSVLRPAPRGSSRRDNLSHSTTRVVSRRPLARAQWRMTVRHLPIGQSAPPKRLPGYFVDRYSFALLGDGGVAPVAGLGFNPALLFERRVDVVRRNVRPCASLGGWVPDPSSIVDVGEFYAELRHRWCEFASAAGMPVAAATLPDARSMRWVELFDQSVFIPRGPAIPGAVYFDRLPPAQQSRVQQKFGTRSPIDFYCLMQQVHEGMHFVQRGEPLLNEVVQASVWMSFLDSARLWCFQRNECSGDDLVRESATVRELDDLMIRALEAGLDTAALIDRLVGPGGYYLCCLLANRFDHGAFTYGTYLDAIRQVLRHRYDREWIAEATARLSRFEAVAHRP